METKELKQFLSSLKDTDIEELTWESDGTRIYFRKAETAAAPQSEQKLPESNGVENSNGAINTAFIRSPMVGTFFYSDSPDRPPFVIEGNHITPGQKIGIIEAMKVIKNVPSTAKGRIIKVLVQNGKPVEYGQNLFEVDTSDVK